MNITPTEFTKRAIATCEHYGFRQSGVWRQYLKTEGQKASALTHSASVAERKKDGLHGLLAGGLHTYASERLHSINEPVFYYNIEPAPKTNETAVSLHIFGVEKSIAEAILIQATRSLVTEAGFSDHMVRVNTLGDSDSQTRYGRELNNYLKRRLEEMPPTARELMKEHSTAALLHLIEKQHDLAYKSPSPLEYLTDQSRKHFREVVEYLEMSETPYEIDPRLMGRYDCYNDSLFAIDIQDEHGHILPEQPLSVRGGRYSSFFERHLRRKVPVAGAVVILKDKRAPVRIPNYIGPKPSIYVIQLGFGPKVRSLLLIEHLRKSGILVNQNLASDSLSAQLREAEDRGARHVLIIGQKEYVDRTVILRDMRERNQECVPIDDLTSKLKLMIA